jgi:hypothetical protein
VAFSFHTVCDIADRLWRSAREKLATRRRFFNNLASITTYAIFDSWQELLETGLCQAIIAPSMTGMVIFFPNAHAAFQSPY